MTFRKLALYVLLPLFLLLLLLTAGSICAAMLLDQMPITSKLASSLDFTPMMTGMRSVNRSIYSALRQPAGKEEVLELTEREFNALLTGTAGNPFAASLVRIRLPDEMKKGRLVLENGVFSFFYPYDIQRDTPFGRFINIRCRFRLSIRDGELEIRVLSCKAGAFTVPEAKVQSMIGKKLRERYSGTPAERIVRAGIVSLTMKEEKAVLRYRPYELIEAADREYSSGGRSRIRETLRRLVR